MFLIFVPCLVTLYNSNIFLSSDLDFPFLTGNFQENYKCYEKKVELKMSENLKAKITFGRPGDSNIVNIR